MKRSLVLVGLGLLMLVALPDRAIAAASLHYMDCKECHKSGMAIGVMGANNTCLECHSRGATKTDSTPAPGHSGNPQGRFTPEDSSDRFGSATTVLGSASPKSSHSHAWGVTDVRAEAGAKAPDRAQYAGFYSRYNASTGKVTCSRCHNPHGDADLGINDPTANPKLLIRDASLNNAPMNPEKMCKACHVDLDKTDSLVINTHPMVIDYAAAQLASPNDLRSINGNTGEPGGNIAEFTSGHASKIQLSSGGVGCVSCHGVHYVDSDSTTTDIKNGVPVTDKVDHAGENYECLVSHTSSATNRPGTGAQWTTYWRAIPGVYYLGEDPWLTGVPYVAATTDGNLLRSDGPNRTGAARNTPVTGTAQLRSNLCQTCHKYELHGQGLSGDHKLGCLDCHNGHDPVGNSSAYTLRNVSNGPVPTRIDRVNSGPSNVTFPTFVPGNTRTSWADGVQGTALGFCEKCHGDSNSVAMVALAAEHAAGNTNQCNACHKHNDPANIYSFNRDASAATCGQCHGFPPYKNVPGDRQLVSANDGGYAENNSADPGAPYNYTNTSHFKDESITGHKVHAGRDLSVSPANDQPNDWYFVGSSGIDNCKVCHGPNTGAQTTEGGHRIAPATRPNTFRDVPFDGIAKTGGLIPVYQLNSPWTCSAVYCHTNGAPYNGANRPNRVFTFVNTSPPWVGNGSNYAAGGFGSIHGKAYACASCHGNTAATMGAGQKQNSAAHLAHLGGATTLNMVKTFSCAVCHAQVAANATTLIPNAMDGRTGGKHVDGVIDVHYDPAAMGGQLTSSTFANTTGVCSTYCHNVTGQAGATVADWDVATDMQCDSCHGGLATDSSGNGGYGPITTGSHGRHILTSGNGPKLLCAECHGTGSDAGTHAGHFDGLVNMNPPVDGVTFNDICEECHGYDAEAGEVLPVWGNAGTTDCATCHAGSECGTAFNGKSPPVFNFARSSGHNRTSNYPVSGNAAANNNCLDCHLADSSRHWDGVSYATSGNGADLMLRTDIGFPATYAGNENAFCANCHGASPAHPTKSATLATRSINTHKGKDCIACHDLHGTSNIQMILASHTEQNSKDNSGTSGYGGTVTFTALTGDNSYDEDDGTVGAAGELNADDLCATCHRDPSQGGTVSHNNRDNMDNKAPDGHKMGQSCFPCHAPHSDPTNAFKVGVGTACNDCHGFPPASGAHRNGISATNPELYAEVHSNTSTPFLAEDRSDCAFCHPGADLFTYDLSADQAAGGARANHAVSQAVRRAALATAVGYETTNFTCTTACHKSINGDGEWDDVNGLNCNSCHYAALAPTSAGNVTSGNSEAVSAVHNKHFDKNNMTCAQCHDVSYSPTIAAVRGVLAHIIYPDYSGAGNDGTLIQGRANAVLDEAAVTRSNMSYSGGAADAGGINNTCSGTASTGFATGCHASAGLPGAPSTPDWDVVIPATSAGCVMCHTNTTNAAFNPVSGLHNNAILPTITGNAHDGSFDNGSGGTADCVTCHTASPTAVVANHINGTMNTGATITVAASAGYSVATNDCATTCHSAGTTWRYKWATSAYATNGTECANCHGDYASGWLTGVTPHTNVPTKGNKHNSVGNLTYPCTDCHAIGSAGYKWTSKWDPTGVNSDHGDDRITMNQTGTSTFTVNTGRAGCTVACHVWDTAHNFPVTTTALLTETVTGPNPDVLCSGCHGGYAPGGTTVLGYWPDGANTRADNTSEDNSGAHLKHMEVLAQAKYSENLTQLLTNNGNGTGDAKQKFLCAYCHGTASGNPMDATHGLTSQLPADVTRFYAQWDLTQSTPDNGTYTPASYTCATVDCHSNKTTPTTNDWYDAPGNGTCIMCHVDVTTEAKHVAHANSPATFGRTIGCADCHEDATNWATNTAPATNHLNGALNITNTGNVAFTYTSNSCGTNDCHEDGKGGPPKTNPYPWNGAALSGCGFCHDASPTTDAHTVHMAAKVSSYVPGSCNACHTAGNNAAHIDNSVNYAGTISAAPGNGSCTNTCHLSPQAGDWTGGPAAITCTDCHSGSGASAYIGGNKTSVAGPNYMPQYNMHVVVPSVTGVVHTAAGLSTACTTCHTTLAGRATHVNGVWTADDADNTNDQHRGLFAAFTDGVTPTCATACHSAGTAWTYKWSASAALTDGSQCANCHGTFATGWNAGVVHAATPTRGNGAHTAVGTLGFPCTDCHALGSSNGAYPFTYTSNDWRATDAGATTRHGDGFVTMNNDGLVPSNTGWARSGSRSGCNKCHDGATGTPNTYDYPATAWTPQTVAGVAPDVSGSCTACHGGTEYWPDGVTAPDRAGKHEAHVHAIATKMAGGNSAANRNASCDYCHPNPGGSGHNDGGAAEMSLFKNILTGALTDPNGVFNAGDSTCSTVDCHFNNAVTPHWYADTYLPAQVTLTPVAVNSAVNPRAVKLSWVSPGDDANVAGTTVYRYDMRYDTSTFTPDAAFFARTDNYVGGMPLAYMQGTTQDVLVDNLTPGTTYYFSLRSQDAADNWSTPSTVVSAVASGDTLKPYFGGADRAYKGDESATINVEWSHAEDHTMPVTYRLWMKNLTAGPLVMGDGTLGTDAPLITGIKGYKYQLTTTNGVLNDEEYQIGVRACDGVTPTANCDTNTEIISVTPTAIALVPKTYPIFRANGAAATGYVGLEKGANFTAASSVAIGTGLTFRPAANQTSPSTYFVDGFSLYITNGNASSTIRGTLGFATGNNFTPFYINPPTNTIPLTADVSMGSRAKGIKTFKFGDIAGKTVNSGQRLAVRLTVVSGTVTSVGWGSAANSGTLTGAERLVNVAPTNPNLQGAVSGALVNLTWTQSTDVADAVNDTVHYDLYGSDDNGATYKYLIATGLPAATIAYSWNTQMHGIALTGAANVAVKIKAGDGYAHTESIRTGLSVNNLADNVAPNAITDLVVKRRAKQGAVMLRWTAPGDDFENNGRAAYYDVRYSTSAITEGNFASATRFYGAPTPGFGGHIEEMEITGLTPLTNYYFAIKTYDDGSPAKGSAISTPKYTTPTPTNQELGGPRCGMCHTTAPSVVESVGNHRIHGITIADCVKCHGSQVASFDLDHQDGELRMGWSTNGPQQPIISGNRVYYTHDGTPAGNVLYDDPNGGGGFYNNNYNGIGDGIDNGTCMNFVAGCHGPAGSPGYGAPNWTSTATLNCADCHGKPDRVNDSVYNRPFDSNTSGGTVATDQVKGSPPIDNHGLSTGKYVGLHEKHLNYSFRFAKGDSCALCHTGRYSDKDDLDGKHGDGYIDVKLYKVAAGADAVWTPGVGVAPGTCGGMSADNCHPTISTPAWDSSVNFDCVQCHGFAGTTPSHVTDTAGGVSSVNNGWGSDPMAGNCTYCHPGGHPVGDGGGEFIVLANSSQVGINYKSGGIHLKKVIGGRTTMNDASLIDTEAELCWGCHEDNSVSEWGADSSGANTATNHPTNGNIYNFGALNKTSWIGAIWTSGNASFGYKTGAIQSTHATGPLGTAAVTSNRFRNHSETVDPVQNLRCSNCHDVHNMNKAPGDNPDNLPALNGPPYLRGTWLSNPYKEDGAPRSTMTYTSQNAYGAVPRGGSAYVADGGYFIDQNSGNPTSGYSVATSAGLCTLCHGTNIDTMDKVTGENLWLGTNGHSNSALGGTGLHKINIFDTGTGVAGGFGAYSGRPTPVVQTNQKDSPYTSTIPDMGYQSQTTHTEGYGYRGTEKDLTGGYIPNTNPGGRAKAMPDFDWGVSIDEGTIDVGYHAFTCSKCHNPHASRLPKLMITNCLDVRQNTWDDNKTSQTLYISANNTDRGKKSASYDSAQNCHRLNQKFTYTATVISFAAPDKIVTTAANYFTTAINGFKVGDRLQVTIAGGGNNNGIVGTISAITGTQLTLTGITDATGASTSIVLRNAGTSTTLEGARGGWNNVTPW